MIICTKYRKNPSWTVDATERTPLSKSRPNDLEDIGQGQGSSHATHPLILLIICTKYGKNLSRTVDATGWTRKVNGQTDRRTDRQGESNISPYFVAEGIKIEIDYWYATYLQFNSFKYISRGKVTKHPTFKLGENVIEVVGEYVYLGVIFNYNGLFTKAINKQITQAKKAMFALLEKAKILKLPIDITYELFERMVLPILLYGSEV